MSIDLFSTYFWGSLICAALVTMAVQFTVRRLLIKNFIPSVKTSLTLKLIVASGIPLFLIALSYWKLNVNSFAAAPKIVKKLVIPPLTGIINVSNTPWPLAVFGGIALTVLGMFLIPKIVERQQSSVFKFLSYTLVSCGLFLPYKILCYLFESSPSEKLRRGTEVIHSPRESIKILKKKVSGQPEGIKIHPDLRIPLEQETKHFLTVATIGAGKTQLIFPMVEEIKKRGDRMLIYDRKGDYTEAFGEDADTVIISPFDKRSIGWNIGKDIKNKILAEEFASGLIPMPAGNSDPVWVQAARDVLTGVIKSLQNTRGENWGFKDLSKILLDKKLVIECCEYHHPGAMQNLGSGGGDDRQSASVFLSLRTSVKNIEYLAEAWSNMSESLSLVEWVENSSHKTRTIIIGGNPRYSGLDNLVVTQIFNLIYSSILSLSDSRSRRIWTINDEQGSQPKIPIMLNALTEGRSKGLRIISAVQSVSQIRGTYGREKSEEWFNSFGTLFGGRVGDSESASFLAKAFGVNRIEKTSTSIQDNNGNISRSIQRTNDPALLDSDFLAIPNPTRKTGTEFWLRVAGWPACKLLYPIKPTVKQFDAKQPMRWVSGGSSTITSEELV